MKKIFFLGALWVGISAASFGQCPSNWVLPTTNSVLAEIPGGITRLSGTGDSKALIGEALDPTKDGYIEFGVPDFGLNPSTGKTGFVTMGIEVPGKYYEFSISSSTTIIASNNGIRSLFQFPKPLSPGAVVKLSKEQGNNLLLMVNGIKAASLSLGGTTPYTFYVKLEEPGAKVTQPTRSFGCEAIAGYTAVTWTLDNPSNSGLQILGSGDALRCLVAQGNRKAILTEVLATGKDGALNFRVKSYGIKPPPANKPNDPPRKGTIDIGITIGTSDYLFSVNAQTNTMLVQSAGVNLKVVDLGKVLGIDPLGDLLEITKKGNDITLKINKVDVALIAAVPAGDATFFVKLLNLNAEIYQSKFNFANPKSNPIFVELKDKLDASYYMAVGGKVYFVYKEEYRSGTLDFKVYDSMRVPQSGTLDNITGTIAYQPGNAAKAYGSNRFVLDTPNSTPGKFYTLEVKNDKNETQLLRFKK